MRGKDSPRHLDYTRAVALLTGVLERTAVEKRMRALVSGLFKHSEIIALAQRLRIAQRLTAGWSFRLIAQETGASTATIATVHRWLKKENPDYRPIISLRLRARDRHRTRNGPFADQRHLSLPGPKGLTRVLLPLDT